MGRPLLARILKPFGQIRESEAVTVLLMFSYSFLAMAAYNIIKPATRSKFIEDLGADNLPYVQLVAGLLIGVIMAGYSWSVTRLPRRWSLPIAQGGIAVVLVIFWLLFKTDQAWVSACFYLVGLILGILLISQFWTLANVLFDPRQAKRLFGFIGGGSSLGGILGSFLAERYVKRLGTENLLLPSAGFMVLCMAVAIFVVHRERTDAELHEAIAGSEKGVSGREALGLLQKSKHLRLIALVISFAAIGACIIDLQLNMATSAFNGQQATDATTAFLARVQLWTSVVGFAIQVLLTSRIYRHFGIGFALLLLPISLGGTAVLILLNAALWAPGLARVVDQSLRYSVDKTTREVLYMPLPDEMKFTAKPFVDVTVDRFARAVAAVLLLFLIKPWGLGLGWQKLSYVSMIITGMWMIMALRAGRGYQAAFRQSIATREIKPAELPPAIADLDTIETLIQELASPDERRVVYAIDFLEALDKRHLITPLLLYHESPVVRARALSVIRLVQPAISARWLPAVESMVRDQNPEVRSAAVGALANMQDPQASGLVRLLLKDEDSRIALAAAMVLAGSDREEDAELGESVLTGLVSDTRESAAAVRRDFAVAIRHVQIPHFRRLLIPLLNDPDSGVAEEAMRTIRKLGSTDFIFTTTLVSLLRNRRQKSGARELLVGYGERVLPILRHFLRDPGEDIWVRRHIPATIAHIPCQQSVDILVDALAESDGFLRFHAIAALERVHRLHPQLEFKREPVEELVMKEAVRYAEYRRSYGELFDKQGYPKTCMLAHAISEKMKRGLDRIYRLLGLLYPWKEIAAARYTIEHGDGRSRANTFEYLDNMLTGTLRKALIPLLEGAPDEEARAALRVKQDRSGPDNTLSLLISDQDPVLSAAAIHFVDQQKLIRFAGELERLTARHDSQCRDVCDAASWALASLLAPGHRRRASPSEALPSVVLADELRTLVLFGSVSIDELFRICDAGQQVRFEAGRLLCQEGLVPDSVQFLLDGRAILTETGCDNQTVEAPAALGFQEVLEGRPMAKSARCAEAAVCMTLRSEDILTMLGDSSELVTGLFRMLSRASDQMHRLIAKGNPSELPVLSVGQELKPIEKGLVLKTIPIFSGVSSEEIIALASVATEVHLVPGSQLFGKTDPPALYTLVLGDLSIESPHNGASLHAEPSDVIGVYETLAGIEFECCARVERDGIVLRVDREDLFDLLAQRSGLLRQVFSALLGTRPARMSAGL